MRWRRQFIWQGPNGYMVLWLALFLKTARPSMINDVIRLRTAEYANRIIDRDFGVHPGVKMDHKGTLHGAAK
ncbi:MAG: hypothetical protein FWD57_13270 [Polyangiaceae bacterium]|nr:hypothetical protein [Polyangiaceae bacterium]